MQATHEVPAVGIKSEVVSYHGGVKIVRVNIPAEQSLPIHYAPRDVVIAVIRGTGRIFLHGNVYPARAGAVFDVPAQAPHGVSADEAVELLVIQTP